MTRPPLANGLGADDALALSVPTRNCSGPGELVRLARAAEDTGYSSVLLAERVTETFSLCQELLHATTSIQVGTAVANARLRHPVAAAMAAMNLQKMSGGRFILGLGTANATLNERKLGLPPVATLRWMREYVAVFRRTCAGSTIDFDGAYFRIEALELDDSAAVTVPLHLAALQPGMQSLAAGVADGVILNLCPVDSLPAVLANLDNSLRQREPGLRPLAISCVVPCCVSEDAERARAAAREVLLDYALHPSAARLFAADAGPELVAAVQSDLLAGRRKKAAARLPEAFVDRFVAAGSPADCAERLAAYRRGGVGIPIVFPRPVDDDWHSATMAVAECHREILGRPNLSRPMPDATAPIGAAPRLSAPATRTQEQPRESAMTVSLPRRLNHVAYVTRDTDSTVRFYRDVLGMRLISYAEGDQVPSTQDATPFLHTFFQMGDGSCIAFFEIEGLAEETAASVIPRWAPHLALSVDGEEELNAAQRRLKEAGVDVTGPVDHEGIWKSIYFFDPNGVRLELTWQSRALTDDDADRAAVEVERWLAQHGTARS